MNERVKNLTGAKLRFGAAAMEMDLTALLERLPARPKTPLPSAPVVPPNVKDKLALDVGKLALGELLSHAQEGQVHVVLPLRAQRMNLGPISVTIPSATALVVKVSVSGGCVDAQGTHCSVEPPVQLPLGRVFHGVYVDGQGRLMANLAGLPDINVSRLALRGLRLPCKVGDLLKYIFKPQGPAEDSEEHAEESGGLLDTHGISVVATGMQLSATPIVLGDVSLTPGAGTRIDVCYKDGVLTLDGEVELAQATVGGLGFHIHGITGRTQAHVRVPVLDDAQGALLVELKDLSIGAQGASFEVPGQATVVLGPLVARQGNVKMVGGASAFEMTLPHVEGTVVEGCVTLKVGGQPVAVNLKNIHVAGKLNAQPRDVSVDLQVTRGEVYVKQVEVDLQLAAFRVDEARCTPVGHFAFNAQDGFAFAGDLQADAYVSRGSVAVAGLAATLGSGTRVEVNLKELAAGIAGLRRASGTARAGLQVSAGRVPLMTGHPVTFSRGAQATVTLDAFAWNGPGTVPTVTGNLSARAQSDECVLDERLLVLPAGTAGATVERFSLDEAGRLRLHGVALELDA